MHQGQVAKVEGNQSQKLAWKTIHWELEQFLFQGDLFFATFAKHRLPSLKEPLGIEWWSSSLLCYVQHASREGTYDWLGRCGGLYVEVTFSNAKAAWLPSLYSTSKYTQFNYPVCACGGHKGDSLVSVGFSWSPFGVQGISFHAYSTSTFSVSLVQSSKYPKETR